MFADFFVDARLGSDKARWQHNRRFAVFFQAKQDMLDKKLVDFHLIRVFCLDFRDAGKKAFAVFLAFQLVAEIAEIQFKRRIRNDEIKFFQTA